MKNIPISTTKDHLSRVAAGANSINAVAELIWNSLDAGANNITADFQVNKLGGLEQIDIKDDGCGIDASQVEKLFGNLGDSWKKTTECFHNRPLHGQKGEGRFKAFALGGNVLWDTVYENQEDHLHYRFSIHGSFVGENPFSYEDPIRCDEPLGTKVTILSISKPHQKLFDDQTDSQFAMIFAGYLHQFPNVRICIDGKKIIPDEYCRVVFTKSLPSIKANDGKDYSVIAEVIEWDISIERKLQFCDASGIEFQATEAGIQAKGERFTIRLKSDYFKLLHQKNLLLVDDLSPEVQNVVEAGRDAARGYFRRKKAAEAANVVQQWKAEKIYPFEEKSEKDLSPVELAERQVFDIIGVNVQDFLPEFDKADNSAKKFTFRLLAQALKDNPDSLQKILTEVLNLDPEKQKDLAELLEKTDLSNIIKCAKTVADRLNFLIGLENLVFDKETKGKLLERDQLHKILENEAWVFDENFTLSLSEAKLNDVLDFHREKLGRMCDDDAPVKREKGQQGRIDLLLGRRRLVREDQWDHLVVELKRPSKKIDAEVISQIQSYAFAIAEDPRFDKQKTRWKVIAVSNEMDLYGERMTHQTNLPVGLIAQTEHVDVWAFSWTQILNTARAKLEFINESLRYEADRESAKQYLLEKYEKFIPKAENEETADSIQDATSELNKEDANA